MATINYYSNGAFLEPFATREQAERKLTAVAMAQKESEYWLRMHGRMPHPAPTLEIVECAGGYKVKETYL